MILMISFARGGGGWGWGSKYSEVYYNWWAHGELYLNVFTILNNHTICFQWAWMSGWGICSSKKFS